MNIIASRTPQIASLPFEIVDIRFSSFPTSILDRSRGDVQAGTTSLPAACKPANVWVGHSTGGGYDLPRKELAISSDVSLHFFLTIYKRNAIYQSNQKKDFL